MSTNNNNIGHKNTGDKNIGHKNTGDFNKQDYCTGAFNTKPQKMILFNKTLDITVDEFYSKYDISAHIPLTERRNQNFYFLKYEKTIYLIRSSPSGRRGFVGGGCIYAVNLGQYRELLSLEGQSMITLHGLHFIENVASRLHVKKRLKKNYIIITE